MITLYIDEVNIITSILWHELVNIKIKLLVPFPEIGDQDDYRNTLNLYIKMMNYEKSDYKILDQTIEKLAMSR